MAAVAQDKINPADEVRAVVEASYINGAFNALDPDAMMSGFHPDFAIFSADGEQIKKYPIGEWAPGWRKKRPVRVRPGGQVWKHKLPIIEITGRAASVKVELYRDGTLVFTDYLSLLKFDSGWRIVAKVYQQTLAVTLRFQVLRPNAPSTVGAGTDISLLRSLRELRRTGKLGRPCGKGF